MESNEGHGRTRRRIIWGCGLLVLVTIGLACFTNPRSPAGRYVADSRIGIEGDFYWEFSRGKVSLIHEGGRDECGTYARKPDGWSWTKPYGKGKTSEFKIQYSWWELRIFDESGQPAATMRRRVVPGLRPRWVPEWIK